MQGSAGEERALAIKKMFIANNILQFRISQVSIVIRREYYNH